MSENNNQMSCMYREVPALQAVNRVAGFDPMKFLRRTVSHITGENVWKLDLRYMRAWFRMARPNGRVRFKPLRITEQLAIFEAQVYMDRSDAEPVSNFTAQCTREEAAGGDYIQAAQDAALETALSNAGFGIQFVDLTYDGSGEEYGSEVPVFGQAVNDNAASAVPITASSLEKQEETVAAAAVPDGNTESVRPVEQIQQPTQQSVQQAAGIVGQSLPAPASVKVMTSLPVAPAAGDKAAAQSSAAPVKTAESQPAASVAAAKPAPAVVKVMTNVPVASAAENKAGNQPAAAPVKTTGKQSAVSAAAAKPVNQPTPSAAKEMTSLPVAPASGDKTGNQPTAAPMQTAGNQAAVSATADSEVDTSQNAMPANVQEAPRYTQDMPVEEIVKLMTLEEAKNVVVETGVCKGWTMGEVAERRAPSLKFYVCVDTKITNNIVRAAAQIMWEKVSREKAS